MTHWFTTTIVETGRLPLFFLMIGFAASFLFIRISTRMIRAEVSWWPGNVTPGGLHIHHVVFGLVMMLVSGFGFIALANEHTPVANCVLAALFGIGSALVLDEFALVLHLEDVYWSQQGRTSIDAVFVAFAITVLFVLGVHPLGLTDGDIDTDGGVMVAASVSLLALQYGLAVITLLKGKVWTGLLGLFVPILIIVGAIRVARPVSPWARWHYADRPKKQHRAVLREKKYRAPISRAKIRTQEFIAGRFDTDSSS
ncbi:hypothetical protein L618_004500000030 [Rhodococcus rhodochrous J45]|uniref:Integral membrane protein n=1 Tax=Rhodococcus rhodochrous J45 TaxID=935266 RepID=A0A562DK90_RHORH|nr:hypothetical protein L618_004500000030 [Rhodococcus rhodochrous J45]